ncbi:MAG: amidohydrolase [Gemmatimonadota bacterium]
MPPNSPQPVLLAARRIHTMDGPSNGQDADALLVHDGRILAVGRASELRDAAGSTLAFPDATITPGLTDSHVHLVEWALSLRRVNVASTDSPEAAAALAASAGPGSGGWIVGHGWSRHRWGGPPHRDVLDRHLPDTPVLLTSSDMHAAWANSAALARAGLDESVADPEGGRIARGPDGRLTGVLYDNAMPLLFAAVPTPSRAERAEATVEGQAVLHRSGITSVHTVEPDSLGLLETLRAEDRLRLRILQHLPLARLDEAIALGLRSGFGGEWIRIGGIKMFLDGSLGSLTAWMVDPYEGTRERGMQTLATDEFRDAIRRAAAAGLAGTVHAIGDAAVGLALDVLAAPEHGVPAIPHRIEHVQLLPPDRAADAGRAGITCSVQPAHLLADWQPADRYWGRERSRRAYAFRSLRDGGAVLAFGSDMPAGPMDPRLALRAATTRQEPAGEPGGGWYPEERLSMAEALESFTVGPAMAAGRPGAGRLAPGAQADLAIWRQDPLELGGAGIMELECRATMIAGQIVWDGDA